MIDKIDRPEAPTPYRINAAKDAKESQHQQSTMKDEQEKRRQEEIAGKEWGKFNTRGIRIKPLRTSRNQIERCLFRSVAFHQGLGTLQLDIVWKDKRTTRGALAVVSQLDDFISLKKLQQGQEIPDKYWSHNDVVELGIIETSQVKGQTNPSIQTLSELKSKRIKWIAWGIYLFIVAITLTALIIWIRG